MNNVSISGRMIAPARITYTQRGDPRAACLITVNARGQPEQLISVVGWRDTATDIRDFGGKGEPVIITGYLSSYKDTSGLIRMDVTATAVEFPTRREAEKIKEKGGQTDDNP